MPRGKPLSSEAQDRIIELYESGLSLSKVATQFGITAQGIHLVLKRRGVKRRPPSSARKHIVDISYFDVIDSPDKAYWLGFLMADGNVSYFKKGGCIHLQVSDAEHLDKFRAVLAPTAPIGFYGKYAWLNIYSIQLVKTLEKHGCVPCKTKVLQFPSTVPDNLLNAFIRGYFDGDGCLWFNRNTEQWYWSVCSGSREFLETMQDVLVQKCGVERTKIYHNRAWYLEYGGNRQVERILDWMYTDSTPEMRLDRKYGKYLEFKRFYKGEG